MKSNYEIAMVLARMARRDHDTYCGYDDSDGIITNCDCGAHSHNIAVLSIIAELNPEEISNV